MQGDLIYFSKCLLCLLGAVGGLSPIGIGNETNFSEVKMDNLKKFNTLEGNRSKELALQHARLMETIEDLPPGTEISPEVEKEVRRLEVQLRRRLYRYLKGGVLPILATAAKTLKKKTEILFHFDVFSLLNTRIDRFKVPAPTKEEAWEEARKRALQYPGQVHLKIS